MRSVSKRGWMGLAAGFSVMFAASTALAAECRGTDLYDTLRAEQPATFSRVSQESALYGPRGRLFRVTSPGGAVSWLFGTAHLADSRVTHLPGPVTEAFAAATTIVTELPDMDPAKAGPGLGGALRHLVASPGNALAVHLTPEESERARAALAERGQAVNAIDVLQPWAVMAMLAISPCMTKLAKSAPVLDRLLIDNARAAGKPVIGLETFAEQAAAFNAIEHGEQVRMTKKVIAHLDRTDDYAETMVQGYLRGEEGVVLALSKVEAGSGFEMNAQFVEHLVVARNVVMAERALPLVEAGGAFIAIGALHLKGDTGLITAFQKRGFRVERLL